MESCHKARPQEICSLVRPVRLVTDEGRGCEVSEDEGGWDGGPVEAGGN